MAPRQYCNGRCSKRRYSALAVRSGVRAQAQPGKAPGQAPFVEPIRIVVTYASWQNLCFPSAGRCVEAFELCEDGIHRFRPGPECFRLNAQPTEQETQEVSRCHRLDLRAQPSDRVSVDAG